MLRAIAHIDMDAFFAAIEQRDDPSLKNKPVIIGGDLNSRGVVCTASYEARKFGVHSAMPIITAHKLCPDGIFIRPDHSKYSAEAKKIQAIFSNYSPLVEPVSLDECFIDLTGTEKLFGDIISTVKKMKKEVSETTGLSCSAGLAPNKFLAKIASDLNKPDGLTIVEENGIEAFLDPLDISKIWGVGKVTEKKLKEMNIRTIRDAKRLESTFLEKQFGKFGKQLFLLARGIDNREVITENEMKSISNENTFPLDTNDEEFLLKNLRALSDKVSERMRKQKIDLNSVTLKIKFSDFRQITLTERTPYLTCDPKLIYQSAKKLLKKAAIGGQKIRLIGVGGNIEEAFDTGQINLFEINQKEKKHSELYKAIDSLRDKFGHNIIKRTEELEED